MKADQVSIVNDMINGACDNCHGYLTPNTECVFEYMSVVYKICGKCLVFLETERIHIVNGKLYEKER